MATVYELLQNLADYEIGLGGYDKTYLTEETVDLLWANLLPNKIITHGDSKENVSGVLVYRSHVDIFRNVWCYHIDYLITSDKRKGTGTLLLDYLITEIEESEKPSEVTWRCLIDNENAIKFYLKYFDNVNVSRVDNKWALFTVELN